MASLPKRTAFVKVFASILFFLFISAGLVSAQVQQDSDKKQEPSTSAVSLITIELVGGGRLEVEELRETSEGIWYRRGGVTTLLDPKRVARIEQPSSGQTAQLAWDQAKLLRL